MTDEYFYLTPTYKPTTDIVVVNSSNILVDEFVANKFSTDTRDEKLIADGEEFLNHPKHGIADAWLAEQRVATELAGGVFDDDGVWHQAKYDDGEDIPAVEVQVVAQQYYSGGSPKDVDLLIKNPRYGNVTVDDEFSWYTPPSWLGGDVKLVRKNWRTPCYTWGNGFVIDDEGDLLLEFFMSVSRNNPLTFLFKTSPSLNYTIVVGMNKYVDFFPSVAAGKPCRKYKTNEPVFIWQLAATLAQKDTQKKTHFDLKDFKLTVTTAMKERQYADAMNTLTTRASYLTCDLMRYVVAEVDPLNKYEFLESLSLQSPNVRKNKRLVDHAAIREMFGLD